MTRLSQGLQYRSKRIGDEVVHFPLGVSTGNDRKCLQCKTAPMIWLSISWMAGFCTIGCLRAFNRDADKYFEERMKGN